MRELSSEAFAGTSRFEVRREVGSGGFGTVYQVWDREHAQLVALKHLHRSDPQALRGFYRGVQFGYKLLFDESDVLRDKP